MATSSVSAALSSTPSSDGANSNADYHPKRLQDVELNRFGLVTFNHLIGEYDSFSDRERRDPEAYRRAGRLKDVYRENSRCLTWGDLTAMECLLLRLRTREELREKYWVIETRYCDVVPPNSYTERLKLSEGDVDTLEPDDLRAKIEIIACEFFRLCVLAECREKMRERASLRVTISMAVFAFLFTLSLLLFTHWQLWGIRFWAVPGILFSGAMGGFISSERRIQGVRDYGEPLIDLVELSNVRENWLPPVLGAVFAAVLYVIFAAGLLNGVMFPSMTVDFQQGHDVGRMFTAVFRPTSGPNSGPDAAKLILWCFIAGFAERFVPNALDRFAANSEKRKRKRSVHNQEDATR